MEDFQAYKQAEVEIKSAIQDIAEKYNINDIGVHNMLASMVAEYYRKSKANDTTDIRVKAVMDTGNMTWDGKPGEEPEWVKKARAGADYDEVLKSFDKTID